MFIHQIIANEIMSVLVIVEITNDVVARVSYDPITVLVYYFRNTRQRS